MSDNGGLDIILYIVVTIGVSILGAIKSYKKQHPLPPVIHADMEDSDEPDYGTVFPQAEPSKQETLERGENSSLEEIRKQDEEVLARFRRSEEERDNIRKNDQERKRKQRNERLAALFRDHPDNAENNEENTKSFNLREAVISSEILNRKF